MSRYKRRRQLGYEFASRVRKRCAELGWTCADLGRAIKDDPNLDKDAAFHTGETWYRNRKSACPNLETVERAAEVLGCEPGELAGWVQPKRRKGKRHG